MNVLLHCGQSWRLGQSWRHNSFTGENALVKFRRCCLTTVGVATFDLVKGCASHAIHCLHCVETRRNKPRE